MAFEFKFVLSATNATVYLSAIVIGNKEWIVKDQIKLSVNRSNVVKIANSLREMYCSYRSTLSPLSHPPKLCLHPSIKQNFSANFRLLLIHSTFASNSHPVSNFFSLANNAENICVLDLLGSSTNHTFSSSLMSRTER